MCCAVYVSVEVIFLRQPVYELRQQLRDRAPILSTKALQVQSPVPEAASKSNHTRPTNHSLFFGSDKQEYFRIGSAKNWNGQARNLAWCPSRPRCISLRADRCAPRPPVESAPCHYRPAAPSGSTAGPAASASAETAPPIAPSGTSSNRSPGHEHGAVIPV